MKPGFARPLYILPFDHRNSYVSEMFGFASPLSPEHQAIVVDSKRLIYDGFLRALELGVPQVDAGILVDEEFGEAILADARERGIATAVATERSGGDEYAFEYGDDWAARLDAMQPTFAKALVRYNPDGDTALNARQTARLRLLSEHCRARELHFMFELLVPATDAQLETAGGDKTVFDRDARPLLMDRAIRELQDAGVEPDIWKIEGLSEADDCRRIVATARRDGRDATACIVLGRGADEAQVIRWLTVAAGVPGFIGFAVGRTSFWDAVAGFHARTMTRQTAVEVVANKFHEWVTVFEKARTMQPSVAA